MKKVYVLILLCCIFIFSFIASAKMSVPTITYFPPDETVFFTEQHNTLTYKDTILSWKLLSKTNRDTYLRQDIALLYMNGLFRGLMNQWKSNTDTIDIRQELSDIRSGLYESISYHYAETHTNDRIRSAATLDYSSLWLDCTKDDCKKIPTDHQTNISTPLSNNNGLEHQWNELISYFSIDEQAFRKIKLTQLFLYRDHPLPSLSQQQTDDIMNHLWEGLYANYIVELMQTKEHQRTHYMPLVLYKEDEIQVLYEINGRKEQLIQKINQ